MAEEYQDLTRLRRLTDSVEDPDYDDDELLERIKACEGDLYLAAAKIWEEKAAKVTSRYDVQADGANLARSQVYTQALRQARFYRSRSRVRYKPIGTREVEE